MSQQGITAIRLPLGSGADYHGNLLALQVRFAILAHGYNFLFGMKPLSILDHTA
jgi:hypothetical protein